MYAAAFVAHSGEGIAYAVALVARPVEGTAHAVGLVVRSGTGAAVVLARCRWQVWPEKQFASRGCQREVPEVPCSRTWLCSASSGASPDVPRLKLGLGLRRSWRLLAHQGEECSQKRRE